MVIVFIVKKSDMYAMTAILAVAVKKWNNDKIISRDAKIMYKVSSTVHNLIIITKSAVLQHQQEKSTGMPIDVLSSSLRYKKYSTPV